jgi:hypothetical protein
MFTVHEKLGAVLVRLLDIFQSLKRRFNVVVFLT